MEERDREPSMTDGVIDDEEYQSGLTGAAEAAAQAVGGRRWRRAVTLMFKEAARKNIAHIAAGVAFYTLLSIFPAITVVITLAGIVADPADLLTLVDQLKGLLPPDGFALIRRQVETTVSTGGLALGSTAAVSALIAFWSAGAAVRALMSAMSLAFPDTVSMGVVGHTLLSLLFTLAGICCVVGLMVLVVSLPIAFEAVQLLPEKFGLPEDLGIGVDLALVGLLQWPILFTVMMLIPAVLYRAGAARGPHAWGGAIRGALIASVAWVLASKALILYITEYGDMAQTYGALGTVAGLMLWFWISAFILLLGAELARALAE